MHILLLLLRTSRWDALIGMAAGAIVGLATSGFAWTLQSVIAGGGQNTGRYALIFSACWLAYGSGAVIADNRLTRVSQRAVRELRLSISRRILGVPLPVLEREQQRIFSANVYTDVEALPLRAEVSRIPWIGDSATDAVNPVKTTASARFRGLLVELVELAKISLRGENRFFGGVLIGCPTWIRTMTR